MFRFSFFLIISISILTSCNAFKPKKVDTREVSTNAQERARKNIEEGRGVSIDGLLGKVGGDTNFEFSTSNPMWRASLEILDFLPLTTVDYSGGMIITDWYSENSSNESIKITVRFLANEVRSDSLKIIIHKRTCSTGDNCKVSLLDKSAIKDELLSSIVRKAAKMEAVSKKKKR
tara:strand:+ start:106 stop:630 length:525 start_codon:yes stop_codon:yes gene_type:complete